MMASAADFTEDVARRRFWSLRWRCQTFLCQTTGAEAGEKTSCSLALIAIAVTLGCLNGGFGVVAV
jgi:hypothetical protein